MPVGQSSVVYTNKNLSSCYLCHYSFKFLNVVEAKANKVSPRLNQLATEVDVGLICTAVSVAETKTEIAPPH